MNKINLDVIMEQIEERFELDLDNYNPSCSDQFVTHTRECMKEAVHQALVLAAKNVRMDYGGLGHFDTPTEINKQSILDIEKLIV